MSTIDIAIKAICIIGLLGCALCLIPSEWLFRDRK